MNRIELIQKIKNLDSEFREERSFQPAFEELLQHPDAYQRYHLPGHLTGSAWIVNEDSSRVLLILHRNLGRWLQPGGHADGDENILNVALREAEEETGLKKIDLIQTSVFDLDIHPIPARKDFPEHLHYDVRFLFQASENETLVISEESKDLKWFGIDEVGRLTGNAMSIARMVGKTRKLSK